MASELFLVSEETSHTSSKEIEEELGMNGEEIKAEIVGNKNGSKFDLYKDKKGNIYVKPKGNIGPGEPAGYNLNNL